jgi:hypothetical protein
MDATSRCSPLETGFGQVDVALDSAQDFVVDGFVGAQGDDGVAFRLDAFARRDESSPCTHFARLSLFSRPSS